MALRVYLNESADVAVASGLRRRNIDAWSARDVGNRGLNDEQQLEYAIKERAVIFTHDDDFLRIAHQWRQQNKTHAGIFFLHAERLSIGESIRRIVEHAEHRDPEEMENRIAFL
ncbi:MAG: DUF5615 family PIN-like protein [Candidatus Poribacteria bacterium]|nr:DUF5615 family PIN-like protein [Candidatus Poribacteria bacterium]